MPRASFVASPASLAVPPDAYEPATERVPQDGLSTGSRGSSRRSSRSTLSSIDTDVADAGTRPRSPGRPLRPQVSSSSSSSSRGGPRRTSTPGTSPALPGTAGTFLSRFVSAFRGQTPSSASPTRPTLPRSVSSPLVGTFEPQPPPRAARPGSGASPSLAEPVASHAAFLSHRLRPSFTRRATTGTSSSSEPPSSPPIPVESTSPTTPTSPLSVRSAERDPMDSATTPRRTPYEPSAAMVKRGSITSQSTVLQGSGNTSTTNSPLGRGHTRAREPHPPLEQPLVLVATLLPPALKLLAFLGPAHLFSPPLALPNLDAAFSPYDASHDKGRQHKSPLATDQASIASSSSSLPSLHSPANLLAPTYSHELYAPSSLSVPAVSAAAVWRIFRGLEWVTEAGTPAYNDDERERLETTFDFPAVIQGVVDVLAAEAASKGVELIVGLVGVGAAPSPITTPAVPPVGVGGGPPTAVKKDTESRELLVRGDERIWSVALIWLLHTILESAESGSTIEARFVATLATAPPPPPADARGSHDTILPTRQSTERWWTISLEIQHSFTAFSPSPAAPLPSPAAPLPPPRFTSPIAQSLFAFANLRLNPGPADAASRSWVVEALLPAARPSVAPSSDPSTLLERQRASLDTPGQEPSMDELKAFVERGLKGTRVLLHAGEQSAFAKDLTTNLADWGMDVVHVPLDRDGDTDTSSGAEQGWNNGRREAFGRYDSGFGHSPVADPTSPSGSSEPTNSPLRAPASDFPSPGSSSSGSGSAGADAPLNLVIVDDDIHTLRRLLYTLRSVSATAPPSGIMGKRPQLSSRRSRSSPHVRQVHQLPPIGPGWVIVHFASVCHYKAIKEIVQDALANCRSPTLPDVLVIPKPAGPRRIITALWTALKRPAVDPSLPPIATSPTSPGIQYWSPRLSPALASSSQLPDAAAGDALGGGNGSGVRGDTSPKLAATKVRTPPLHFSGALASASTHPPSPLGKISDEQVSYFACVAETMDGTSPSEGMVIQSPDGRPAIFFQPQQGRTRASLGKERAGSRVTERDRDSPDGGEPSLDGASTPLPRGPVSAPHEIGLGGRRSTVSTTASPLVAPSEHHHPHPLAPPDTPALTLDSFIAKSRGVSESNTPELVSSPLDVSPPARPSGTSLLQRTPSRPSTASPRTSAGSSLNARLGSPQPMSPRGDSPAPSGVHAAVAARREASAASAASAATAASQPPNSRRGSGISSGNGGRRKGRRNTSGLATVPPINVLIVEDNPINQMILSMFMKKKGIKYAVAKDGEEAVRKWKEGSFHLVLMDIQLPVKDGIEATRDIREMERANNIGTFITTPTSDSTSPPSSQATTPMSPLLSMPVIIVALTASSLQIDRVTALAAGCNDFLTKPVSLPWLQQKLLEWGSMAYLSGFSRASSDPASEFAKSKPAFSAGLNARAKADEISAHLHIHPRPSSRSSSPARPQDAALHPAPPTHPMLTISSPTPVLTPSASTQAHVPVLSPDAVAEVNNDSAPDMDAVDGMLEDLKAQAKRPGPTPLSEPTLESVVAEGARLAIVGRSRANSATTDSFSKVMHHSGAVSSSELSSPHSEDGH